MSAAQRSFSGRYVCGNAASATLYARRDGSGPRRLNDAGPSRRRSPAHCARLPKASQRYCRTRGQRRGRARPNVVPSLCRNVRMETSREYLREIWPDMNAEYSSPASCDLPECISLRVAAVESLRELSAALGRAPSESDLRQFRSPHILSARMLRLVWGQNALRQLRLAAGPPYPAHGLYGTHADRRRP